METHPMSSSPKWGSTTKMIFGLASAAIFAALVIRFRNIVGPLLLAFILAYLMQPISALVSIKIKIPWRMAVTLVYLLLVILLVGLMTLAGFAIVQQVQSLFGIIQNFITNLPALIEDLSTREFVIGHIQFNLRQFDLTALTNQLLSSLQSIMGRAGSLVSTFATGAASTLGWTGFVLLTSYFLLADMRHVSDELVHISLPGYNDDIRHLGSELRAIWNAFLRGQLIIIVLVIIVYSIATSILGLRYGIGIAVMAGLARFIPYLGPFITLSTAFLVAITQGGNYFGLDPIKYSIVIIITLMLLDQVFDNMVQPRFLGSTLGVHPAAVLIGALIAANLIGIVGLLLAAPVMATLKLLAKYIGRKMLDLDPWIEIERQTEKQKIPLTDEFYRLLTWLKTSLKRIPRGNSK